MLILIVTATQEAFNSYASVSIMYSTTLRVVVELLQYNSNESTTGQIVDHGEYNEHGQYITSHRYDNFLRGCKSHREIIPLRNSNILYEVL